MATQATFLHVQSKSPFPNEEFSVTCNKIPVKIRTLAVETLRGKGVILGALGKPQRKVLSMARPAKRG